MEPNIEKHENYKNLKVKLKKALQSKFWFEACMIEYAIIEDRTSSILFHSKVSANAYDSNKLLANKLNSIEYQINKNHNIISKKVNIDTIIRIKKWKETRNDFVHRSCKLYDEKKAEELAVEGKELCELITNDSAKVKRLARKLDNNN